MKTCPKCGATHTKSGTFCSRTCANARVWSSEQNKSRSTKAKDRVAAGNAGEFIGKSGPRKERLHKVCPVCNKQFDVLPSRSDQQYCSRDCHNTVAGGYREGSGHAITGYYKGIYCGSTYELVWVIYNIDHGVSFTRFPGKLSHGGISYIPDFLVGGKIVEIKGFESDETVQRKSAVAKAHGYDVIVLRKDDLSKEFDWVKRNYRFKHVEELYDTYAPAHQYACDTCGVTFGRKYPIKSQEKFCSRSCAGKRRSNKRHTTFLEYLIYTPFD